MNGGKMLLKLILLSVALCSSNAQESRTVNIVQGPVKGYKSEGWDIFEFHGIPYATAPTGRNRFKAPLEAPSWDDTFEAVDRNIMCPQRQSSVENVVGAKVLENCLIANLYVPDTNNTDLPVLVFMHGGAFQNGHAASNTPRNLVQSKDIIVAMFNYRLGPHGFLCLGTENAPGNAGMKDQVAFLRWVQKNIAVFGGNPRDVTIYGSSAGARAVDLLTISKITDGLFKGMIGDSGITLGASTVQIDPIDNAKTFAKMLDFNNVDDRNALEEFYLNASYDLLTSIDTTQLIDFLFSPCVEQDVGQEIFLDASPFQILKSGDYRKIPILYGYSEFEGTFRNGVFQYWKDAMNANLSDFLPHDLQFPSSDERESVAEEVKAFYFGDEVINEQNILLFIHYFTDTMYVYPMLRAVRLHLEAGHENVYLYEYSFTSEESSLVPYINKPGAFHSAQTNVIFDYDDETTISTEFKNMKSIMREMWYNFISSGEPVPAGSTLPSWPPMQLNNMILMSLNHIIELKPLEHRSKFWNDIYDKYYKEPIPPRSSSNQITMLKSMLISVVFIQFTITYYKL